MKRVFLMIALAVVSATAGCALSPWVLVPCNHTMPVVRWRWCQEAIDCRKMQEQDRRNRLMVHPVP